MEYMDSETKTIMMLPTDAYLTRQKWMGHDYKPGVQYPPHDNVFSCRPLSINITI